MAVKMFQDGLVDGGGYISDESDFYGEVVVRKRLEKRIGHNCKSSYDTFPRKRIDKQSTKRPRTTLADLNSDTRKSANPGIDAVGFLKNRPQGAHLQNAALKSPSSGPASTLVTRSSDDLVDNESCEGNPSAWQHHETVADFVKRAPVAMPSTADLGPWLWVGSPRVKSVWKERSSKADVDAFVEGGQDLLRAFTVQKDREEQTINEPASAKISRKMAPYRVQLEDDLLTLAVKTSTTCGKWMLFPTDEDYPRYWRVVAEATAAGKLGPTSKAATYNEVDPLNLICIYTYDFTDREDVVSVLEELIELGLCARDGKPIYYKCDAYTYLGISSNNSYKIGASLYSSKALLAREEQPKKDGPIDRLKKRGKTIDAFFS